MQQSEMYQTMRWLISYCPSENTDILQDCRLLSKTEFNPEMQLDSPALRQPRLLVEDCSEEEAAAIIPIFQAALKMARNQRSLSL